MECWGAHFLDLMDEAWGGEGRGGEGRGFYARRLLDEAWARPLIRALAYLLGR
jgi:hypothetical protein